MPICAMGDLFRVLEFMMGLKNKIAKMFLVFSCLSEPILDHSSSYVELALEFSSVFSDLFELRLKSINFLY